MTKASTEMIWLQSLSVELRFTRVMNVLHSDNQNAIDLANISTFHSNTKHIPLRYHFIRFLLEDRVLTLMKIQGNMNLVDMLTKTVIIKRLELCVVSVGLG